IDVVYLAYLVLYFLSLWLPSLTQPVKDYGMLLLAVAPAVLVIQSGLSRSRFWQAVAFAHLMWGIGQVLSIVGGAATELQDSMYWLFKLFILGAILYRPFYTSTDWNRRLHLFDTVVAVSIIAYYILYFFILPSMTLRLSATFYGSLSNVLLNTG